MSAADALIRRLQVHDDLSPEDIEALQTLPIHERDVPAHTNIVKEGDRPGSSCLVIEGFVCRSRNTSDGKRQILSIHIPGDIPDLQSLHLHVLDHDVWTASPAKLGFISHDSLRDLCSARPVITNAFWRETLIDAAIFREWIVNVGRRDARGAMAHLLVEQAHRLRAVGIGNGDEFPLPLTQMELADALGLTPVHVNRVLQGLRKDNLLEVEKDRVKFLEPERIRQIAGFEHDYLHESASS
jgi:CRP-like cAMP-binding protein